jgi:RNA polymerase sigma factor (sigma-70 family)
VRSFLSAGQIIVEDQRAIFSPRLKRAANMATGADRLLSYIRRLAIPRASDPASDSALLARYLAVKDEEAFAVLVHRHGPLVLNVCRRVLGDIDDAEDAFQATFLVLARKAATVHPREALPAWLHGVARRVALKARSARNRRCRESCPLLAPTPDPNPDPLAELSAREVLVIIDEELQRLAEVYRLPVILCCLEGRTLEEAARQLGWTPGSVRARLERGRARLHDRLIRRGLTLSAALAVVEVSRAAASAAVVAQLVALTVRGAMAFGTRPRAVASGVSAQAAALAGETLRAMALARLTSPAALLLATCLLATGFLTYKLANSSSPEPARDDSSLLLSEDKPAPPAAALVQNQPLATEAFNAPITIRGRVLDPEGTPIGGAKLYVGYSPRPSPFTLSRSAITYSPRATSAADGRFHFAFARSELDAKLLDVSRPAVVAVASGCGPDWAVIGDSAEGVELSLKLVKDLPVNGRILDQNRKPVGGANIRVDSVLSAPEAEVTRYLQGNLNSWSPKSWMGSLPGQPAVVTTDADGRFRVTGIGCDRIVGLALEGPAIGHTILSAATRPTAATPYSWGISGATFDHAALTSRPIRGVVRDKVTAKPVPGVQISAFADLPPALTDEDGRYELLGCPKAQGYMVTAQPQGGQPYFAAETWVRDGPGLGPLTLNFDLVSGIPVHGRVTDQATQKPPRTAVVEYYPLFPNVHSAKITTRSTAASTAVIRPDGTYGLVVLPGPGIVCVAASPFQAYAVAILDGRELVSLFNDDQSSNSLPNGNNYRPGQNPRTAVGVCCVNRYHAMSLIKPGERAESLVLDLTVQSARTLRGTVAGLDGKPLTGVRVVGLIATPEDEVLGSASFTVMGLNPRRSRDLCFRHEKMDLGKYLTIQGDETNPLTVQLEPCGTVVGRILDKAGKPIPGVHVGVDRRADYYTLTTFTSLTDAHGRFQMKGLVPGPKYTFTHNSSRRLLRDVGEVEVESGRSKDLGDVVLGD